MSVGILLCGELGLEPPAMAETPAAVIADLCRRPAAAAGALRRLGVGRVVLGLCEEHASPELIGALLRGGAEPFGIEPVMLRGHEREAPRLLTGAVAKLARLAPDEHGKPTLAAGGMSRRALFSPHALLRPAPVAVVDETACLGSADCGLCAARCPVAAIDTAGQLPAVDESACTACGECVAHCPAGALRLSGSSTAQIEAQLEPLLDDIEGVLFACRSARAVAPPGWALIELPTLAMITPAWILQARARGPMVKLAPCAGACCAGSVEVEALAELIMVAGDGGDRQALTPLHLTEPYGTADAVLALVPDGEAITVEHSASPLGLLELDVDRCTLCGACSIACPTGALTYEAHAQRERCMVCGTDLPPASMRRRLRELLPQLAGTPLELCTGCASRAVSRPGRPGSGGLAQRSEAKGP